MSGGNIPGGVLLLVLMLGLLSLLYFRAPKRGRFRLWGWAGLFIIAIAEYLLFRAFEWVTIFFTPIVWTGYLLLVDAAVASLRGDSRLSRAPGQFLALAMWSVPLWLIFEAYNLRLENWTYVGLPENVLVRSLGYGWSFATIWPAIFETADLVNALGLFRAPASRRVALSSTTHGTLVILGLVLITIPVLVSPTVGQFLFGAVWVGFILLLDPLNYRWNGASILRDLEMRQKSVLCSLLVAGLICGLLWEFWNFWARAKWLYVFPLGQDLKIFEMPVLGYLGFPAFALECFVLYESLGTLKTQFWGVRGRSEVRAAGGSAQ